MKPKLTSIAAIMDALFSEKITSQEAEIAIRNVARLSNGDGDRMVAAFRLALSTEVKANA